MLTAATSGIEAAMAASLACAVPGTDALTFSFALSTEMCEKSAGRALAAPDSQSPAADEARNQRPAISAYISSIGRALEDIHCGVGHVGQRCPGNRRVLRGAASDDRFRWTGGHYDQRGALRQSRRGLVRRSLAAQGIDLVSCGSLLEHGLENWLLGEHSPRPEQ